MQKINKKAIETALLAQNPLHIIGIVPKIVYANRRRDSTITKSLSGETALEKRLSNREVESEQGKRVRELYRDIVKEAKETED